MAISWYFKFLTKQTNDLVLILPIIWFLSNQMENIIVKHQLIC